jgi:hypothetical protein
VRKTASADSQKREPLQRIRRGLRGGLALSLTVALGAVGCGEGRARLFLSIGTGGTGGIYYPLGGALANRLSQADSTRRFTAEVTGGSVENVNRVAAGEMDLGFTLSTTLVEAYTGGQDFPRALTELRIVAPLYPNVTHVLVGRDQEIRSIADFRGRRVSVGAPGSGTEQISKQMLETAGLTYEDVDERFLSFRESTDALRDGAIDGAILSVGYPAAAVLEAATSGAVRLLAVDEAHIETLMTQYPYYRVGTIPAGAYPGLDRSLRTVSVMNWIVGTTGLDGEVVVSVLRTLDEERARLEQVHGIAAQVDLAVLRDRAPIPLHDAASQWLERRPEVRDQ